MMRRKLLALLCATAIACMSLTCVLPALADGEASQEQQAAEEAAKKAAEEEAAKKAAEEEAAKKAAEEEAAKKAAEEAAKEASEKPTEAPAEKPTEAPAENPTEAPAEKPTEAPAEKPTEAPAEKPTEAPAENPTEAPAENPTEAPSENPTEAPAENPTEAPTENPTEAPSENPTEAPSENPTEAPSENPTEAPTENPTEAPTENPTEAPTEEPTAEPTEAPLPATLSGLSADHSQVNVGSSVNFSYSTSNAQSVIWFAQRSDGIPGGSGSGGADGFSWQPPRSGIYTITVNATGGGVTVSDSCRVSVVDGELKAKVKTESDYCVNGDGEMKFYLSVTGGCEPYSVNVVVEYKGKELYKSSTLTSQVTCGPKGYGENVLTLVVKDALGNTAKAKGVIISSGDETNKAPGLPALSSDMTFSERLVAVAKSQLGYREMHENFGYKEDGTVQGWSYYGAWYGMPYEEWCAMFVCYCLDKSGVGKGLMGGSANCNRWKGYLGGDYIDDEDNYIPEPGDLIFFHHDRVNNDPNFPNHIGIVVDYDAEKEMVYTVEGNAGAAVSARQYSRGNSMIVGYASMRTCMTRWDKVYQQRLEEEAQQANQQ